MPRVCRDIIKVVYPLYNAKTNVFSGMYTNTDYDVYIYNKIKYVRGKPEFYAEDLTNKPAMYKHVSEMPKTIEDRPDYTKYWKRKYNNPILAKETNAIENYVTYLWLSK